jgi:CheY-like chemotaxis protein
MTAMLHDLQLHAESVGGGEEALQRTLAADQAGEPFDLLIIDWRMPGIDGIETLRRLQAMPLRQRPAHLLVTAFDEPEVYAAARQAGSQGVLVKPVTPSSLHDTLLQTLEAAAAPSPPREESLGPAEARVAAAAAGLRLLLCEDNPINQEVALELLRAAGLAADVAENGAVAVQKARQQRYDLILMDVQMPLMDGLVATRLIRALPGQETVPILAMTANAFGEDRQRCLAAGMNDHIPKPVDPEALFQTLIKWLPQRYARPPSPVTPVADAEVSDVRARLERVPGLDLAVGLAATRGKGAKLMALLHLLLDRHGDDLPRLRGCLAAGDLEGAEHLAHGLKGAAGTLGLRELHRLAAELNLALRERRAAPEIAALAAALDQELHRFAAALADLPADLAEPPKVNPDWVRMDEILDQLELLLTSGDVEAGTLVHQELSLLRAGFGPQADLLRQQIDDFDFEPALERLESLRRHLAAAVGPG